MNTRCWLWLLPLVSLVLAPPQTPAQTNPSQPSKQSHRDLSGALDMNNVQEMMAQRMNELRELHQLQDQVQGLLKDPDFLNHIKQHFSEDQLRHLQEKMLKGEGLKQDKNWNQLLQQATKGQKFDQRQLDFLRRWAERDEHKSLSNENGLLNNRSLAATSSSSSSGSDFSLAAPTPPPAAPQRSFFDRMQEESTKWLMEHLDDVGGNVLDSLVELGGSEEGAPLAEALRSLRQSDFSGAAFDEQAVGLSQYLPNVGNFLHGQRGAWDEVRSLFRNTPVPSLPSIGGSSASVPASSATSGDSWAPALISLLMLSLLLLLLAKRIARTKAQAGSGAGDAWRLGSWPVAPNAVATRQDVIRAFEYLALLRLGPTAATCHHRELAQRLAEQDNSLVGRRQAADMLAGLYEQARYAPVDETLSPEELSDARHTLTLLAGVTAA